MMVAQVRAEIKALGNVNVGAIEEYEQVKERYEFLRVQVSDVEKSKAELLQLIAQLCEEMRDMFSKSFAESTQLDRPFKVNLPDSGQSNRNRYTFPLPSDVIVPQSASFFNTHPRAR